jgi:UDP-N-acetylglucosamine diphosphorylase / glucose-1-phosphate thymidylyltransferase / UDP-N-acetylgalactosamine diphosphorylase / glucosamine-1-phosphate N-acetyltransferase / galactosamine-1-phosphate N-acetyltransferase
MKALILAAGKGERLKPLTDTLPKVMLPVAGKPILEHNLSQLTGLVDEVVIVTGYMGATIKDYFGDKFSGMKLSYVEQKEQLGSGHALMQAKGLLKGRFIMMMGDDLYKKEDIARCAKNELAVLCMRGDTRNFGACVEEDGMLKRIVEKSEKPVSPFVNTGLYVLDERVFSVKLAKSPRGEYEATDAVNAIAAKGGVKCVQAGFWIPVGYPWKLLEANEALLKEPGSFIHPQAKVSEKAVIEGPVYIGKGATLRNCVVRGCTSIGEGAVIGNFVEIKNSIIMANTKIPHLSYVGDSVIGEECNFGAGTKVANLRFDDRNVMVSVKGKPVDSGRRKLGCIMGKGCKTGINATILPGAVIPAGGTVGPGEIRK